MIKDMANNLFPSLKTFLAPAKDIGNIKFVKLSEIAGARPDYVTQSDIEQANFTRPNSPEDPTESGATVIDADGTIRKLAEDEAPWSYPEGGAANGCLRLLNLPEAKNEVKTFDPTADEASADNITYITKNWGLGPNLQNAVSFGDNSVLRFRYAGLAANNSFNTLSCYVEMDNGAEPTIGDNAGDDFYVNIAGGTPATIIKKENVKGNIWRIVGKKEETDNTGLNVVGLVKKTISSPTGFTASGFTVVQDNEIDQGDIITTGAAITRNSSQATFTDLVNKGVTGPEGFSLFFDFDGYEEGELAGDNAIVFKDSGVNVVALFGITHGFTVRDKTNNSYLDVLKRANTKLILTFDGQRVKFYFSGAKQIDGNLSTGGHVIDEIIFNSEDNFYNIYAGSGVAPYVLPEATAAALTA